MLLMITKLSRKKIRGLSSQERVAKAASRPLQNASLRRNRLQSLTPQLLQKRRKSRTKKKAKKSHMNTTAGFNGTKLRPSRWQRPLSLKPVSEDYIDLA